MEPHEIENWLEQYRRLEHEARKMRERSERLTLLAKGATEDSKRLEDRRNHLYWFLHNCDSAALHHAEEAWKAEERAAQPAEPAEPADPDDPEDIFK